MVGPSYTDAERRTWVLAFKAGFVGVVAASAGFISLWAGGSLVDVALWAVAGVAVGGLLVWYVSRLLAEFQPSGGRTEPGRRRRP